MPEPSKGLLIAGTLGLVGVLIAAKGWEHREPPKYRVFGGPSAIWDIPDGAALPPSSPRRLKIPSAGVDAPISATGSNQDGTIAVPAWAKAGEAAWYDESPQPGTRGASIIVGHYDDDKGGAVFYRAHKIKKNDRIEVARADGSVAIFKVDAMEQVNKALFPSRRVYGRIGYAGLRLITCGGQFYKARRHFSDNVIIYAHLVRERTPRPPKEGR